MVVGQSDLPDYHMIIKEGCNMINITSSAVTNVGKVRGNNEDNYFINGKYRENIDTPNEEYDESKKRDKYIFSVCDGMGGESYGELASLIAVKSLLKYKNKNISEHINEYVEFANRLICDEIEKNDGARIGSTVALLYIDDSGAYGYNIGDSRIYLMRDGCLKQLSKDHTQAQSMVDMGLIEPEEMNSHKGKHKLTQHFGIFPDELVIQPYETEKMSVKENDIFVLCSDGLTDMMTDSEIAETLAKELSPKEMANKLVDMAVEKGGKDNTTVIVAKVSEDVENRTKTFWSKLFDK